MRRYMEQAGFPLNAGFPRGVGGYHGSSPHWIRFERPGPIARSNLRRIPACTFELRQAIYAEWLILIEDADLPQGLPEIFG